MIPETVGTLTQHDLHKEQMNGKRTLIQKLIVKDLLVIFGIHFFTKHRGSIITTKAYIIFVIGMFLSSKSDLNELIKLNALTFSTTTVSSKASVTSNLLKSKYRITIAKTCVIEASVFSSIITENF